MTEKRYTPEDIRELGPGEVFVFGSNLSGMHGSGGRVHRLRTAASGTDILSHPYRLRHRRLPGRGDCPAVQGRRRDGQCNPAPKFFTNNFSIKNYPHEKTRFFYRSKCQYQSYP